MPVLPPKLIAPLSVPLLTNARFPATWCSVLGAKNVPATCKQIRPRLSPQLLPALPYSSRYSFVKVDTSAKPAVLVQPPQSYSFAEASATAPGSVPVQTCSPLGTLPSAR